tara:strand:- start:51 stop:470 length:420 start_codon:yes stop_codon:yes gene_type:complete
MKNIFLIVGLALFLTGCEELSQKSEVTESKIYLVCDGYDNLKYKDGIRGKNESFKFDDQHSMVIDEITKEIAFDGDLFAPYTESLSAVRARSKGSLFTLRLKLDFVVGKLDLDYYKEEDFNSRILETFKYNCKKVEPLI